MHPRLPEKCLVWQPFSFFTCIVAGGDVFNLKNTFALEVNIKTNTSLNPINSVFFFTLLLLYVYACYFYKSNAHNVHWKSTVVEIKEDITKHIQPYRQTILEKQLFTDATTHPCYRSGSFDGIWHEFTPEGNMLSSHMSNHSERLRPYSIKNISFNLIPPAYESSLLIMLNLIPCI